jgi:hypothetical protein
MVEAIFPKLISFLCVNDVENIITSSQASALQLAIIISYALQFDLIKVASGLR